MKLSKDFRFCMVLVVILFFTSVIAGGLTEKHLQKQIDELPHRYCHTETSTETIEIKSLDYLSGGWTFRDCEYFTPNEGIICEDELEREEDAFIGLYEVCNNGNQTRICLKEIKTEICEIR